jgi:hypothetical protein
MTDCVVGELQRAALAAGAGDEAAFVATCGSPPTAVLVLLGVLTTFAPESCSSTPVF